MKSFLLLLTYMLLCGLAASAQPSRVLDIGARTAGQRDIEQVYWQHRIWPEQNTTPKPALEARITSEQLQQKAEHGLRLSRALEAVWHAPITGSQLQAEMNRMARDSRRPDMLRDLFAALDDDPMLVAEVLARPALAERLARNFYEHDQRFNARQVGFDAWWSKQSSSFAAELEPANFSYTLPEIAQPAAPDSWFPTHDLPDATLGMTAVWTGSEMIVWGGGTNTSPVFTGSRYDPATDTWHSTNNLSVPFGKTGHTAVWTGTEMIVWGGCDLFRGEHTCDSSDGARYNPVR